MGYLFAGLGIVVLCVLFFVLLGVTSGRMRSSRGILPSDHPVQRTSPSADEPTPGDSLTAKRGQIEKAQERTPPA